MKPVHAINDIVIANGNQWSTDILLRKEISHAAEIGIYGPATLPETVTVYVSPIEYEAESDYSTSDFFEAESPPDTAVKVNAGSCTTVTVGPWFALRLYAGGATAGARTFKVVIRDQSLGLK